MTHRRHRSSGIRSAELAVRLHDAAAGLAVGIGLLKVEPQITHTERLQQVDEALAIVVDVQANLKQLSQTPLDIGPRPNTPSDLRLGLNREAKRLGVDAEVDVDGEIGWLPANYSELVWLASREGLRNVRRHSGSATCRIQLQLRSCPFVLRIRDWGGGLEPGAHLGTGIGLLQDLATMMGCDLRMASLPDLGADLVLVGPPCAAKRGLQGATATTALHTTREIPGPRAGNP